MKLDKLLKAADEAKDKKADLTAEVKRTSTEEKRTKKVGSYIKPSEEEKFLSLIGRKSTSDAIRELILDFNKKNTSMN